MFRSIVSAVNRLLALPFVVLCRFWKLLPSKLLGQNCRFHPSCAEYAAQALVKYGLFPGLMLASKRVFRCHPFNPGGLDPLP